MINRLYVQDGNIQYNTAWRGLDFRQKIVYHREYIPTSILDPGITEETYVYESPHNIVYLHSSICNTNSYIYPTNHTYMYLIPYIGLSSVLLLRNDNLLLNGLEDEQLYFWHKDDYGAGDFSYIYRPTTADQTRDFIRYNIEYICSSMTSLSIQETEWQCDNTKFYVDNISVGVQGINNNIDFFQWYNAKPLYDITIKKSYVQYRDIPQHFTESFPRSYGYNFSDDHYNRNFPYAIRKSCRRQDNYLYLEQEKWIPYQLTYHVCGNEVLCTSAVYFDMFYYNDNCIDKNDHTSGSSIIVGGSSYISLPYVSIYTCDVDCSYDTAECCYVVSGANCNDTHCSCIGSDSASCSKTNYSFYYYNCTPLYFISYNSNSDNSCSVLYASYVHDCLDAATAYVKERLYSAYEATASVETYAKNRSDPLWNEVYEYNLEATYQQNDSTDVSSISYGFVTQVWDTAGYSTQYTINRYIKDFLFHVINHHNTCSWANCYYYYDDYGVHGPTCDSTNGYTLREETLYNIIKISEGGEFYVTLTIENYDYKYTLKQPDPVYNPDCKWGHYTHISSGETCCEGNLVIHGTMPLPDESFVLSVVTSGLSGDIPTCFNECYIFWYGKAFDIDYWLIGHNDCVTNGRGAIINSNNQVVTKDFWAAQLDPTIKDA